MKKLLASVLLAATMVLGVALPASAHHVVSINTQVGCDGFSGQAVLNVFGNHSYQVTAPGFDTGIVTEPGQNHNVTVTYGVDSPLNATSGTVKAVIWNGANGTGGIEAQQSKDFAVEGTCSHDVKFRVGFRMTAESGPVSANRTYSVEDGSTITLTYTRCPRFLGVSVDSVNGQLGEAFGVKALPRRTTMHVTLGSSVDRLVYARTAGHACQVNTVTYSV